MREVASARGSFRGEGSARVAVFVSCNSNCWATAQKVIGWAESTFSSPLSVIMVQETRLAKARVAQAQHWWEGWQW
eukprot:9791615-Prorocentrum_lima.AAC.1